MRVAAAGIMVVMLVVGFLAAVVIIPARVETVTTTLTQTQTIVSTSTQTTTVTGFVTVTNTLTEVREGPGSAYPPALASAMEKVVPGSTSAPAYHIYLPAEEGVYGYNFAVYWRYRENLTYVIVFHKQPGTSASTIGDSLIQTRFAAAWNIPNNQAHRAPRANLTEIELKSGGGMKTNSWNILPVLQGYPTKPVTTFDDITVWVVTYRLLEMPEGASDENMVARYYFIEIAVKA